MVKKIKKNIEFPGAITGHSHRGHKLIAMAITASWIVHKSKTPDAHLQHTRWDIREDSIRNIGLHQCTMKHGQRYFQCIHSKPVCSFVYIFFKSVNKPAWHTSWLENQFILPHDIPSFPFALFFLYQYICRFSLIPLTCAMQWFPFQVEFVFVFLCSIF